MTNGYEQEAGRLADRYDDGSPNAGTLALVSAILAVAEELKRNRLGEHEVTTDVLYERDADQARRIADLELAMRALAPHAEIAPAEVRQRLALLEGKVGALETKGDQI